MNKLAKVTVILVQGDNTNVVDHVINDASRGVYSHSAVEFPWGVVESLGIKDADDKYPGVWLHDPGKYDNATAKFIEVDLPDIARAEAEARRLIGTLYGYTDCVRGGLYDLLGVELEGNKLTANCSETVTRILRAGGLVILPDVEPDCITPNDLGRWFDGQATAG